jgi:hypothetical protein
MPGYYDLDVPATLPEDFDLRPIPGAGVVPPEMRTLHHDVYETIGVLKALRNKGIFDDNPHAFGEFVGRVIQATRAGLVGSNAQPRLGRDAIDQIRAEIVMRRGVRMKILYLLKLLAWAALGLIPALILLAIGWVGSLEDGERTALVAGLGWVWIGALVGAWMSAAYRRGEVDFAGLPRFLDARFEPALRILFVGLLSVVVALGIRLELLEFSIEGHALASYTTDPLIGLLIGFVCGFAERAISRRLAQRVEDLVPRGDT